MTFPDIAFAAFKFIGVLSLFGLLLAGIYLLVIGAILAPVKVRAERGSGFSQLEYKLRLDFHSEIVGSMLYYTLCAGVISLTIGGLGLFARLFY